MSDPHASAPSHGHPESDIPSTRDKTDVPATASHPGSSLDPTTVRQFGVSDLPPTDSPTDAQKVGTILHSRHKYDNTPQGRQNIRYAKEVINKNDPAQRGLSTAAATGSSELAGAQVIGDVAFRMLKDILRGALRQYPDFPSKGILFEDIMPIFANPELHLLLIENLESQVARAFPDDKGKIDVVVGLESRGFLFGPSLAMRLGAGFVPVRKQGKLPGEVVTEGYKKEYGEDFFQMQKDAIKPGSKVLIVDDIIATGGSAKAAGNLVKQLQGKLVGYVFIMELDFLKGREKLDAPVHTLLSGQDEALSSSESCRPA